jgi:hypothetical protein
MPGVCPGSTKTGKITATAGLHRRFWQLKREFDIRIPQNAPHALRFSAAC